MQPFPVTWMQANTRHDPSSGYQSHSQQVECNGLCRAFVRGENGPEAIIQSDGSLVAVPISKLMVAQ